MLNRRAALQALFVATCFSSAAFAQDASLVEAARKEGGVVWYSSVNVDTIVRPMAAAFEAKYGIPVTYVTGGSTELASRLINEGQVGKIAGDLWDGSSTFSAIDAASLAEPVAVSSAAEFPADLRAPDGKWYAQSLQYYGPAINTGLVPEAEWPKSYDDLLNPRWKGTLVWPAETGITSPVGLLAVLLQSRGEEGVKSLFGQLRDQQIAEVAGGNRVVLDQVISGQYEIALVAQNIAVESSKERGAPIQFLGLDPAIGMTSRIGAVKGAPHPNAARLFLEFVLSQEGQGVYREAGYIPANPAVAPANPALSPATGNFKAVMLDLEHFDQRKDEWVGLYESLTR